MTLDRVDLPGPGPVDDDSIDRVLRASLPALRSYVRARLSPALAARESASDVVQSVCRELVLARQGLEYRSDEALRGWLFSTAQHKIWQHHRYWRAGVRAQAEAQSDGDGDPASAGDGPVHLQTPSLEAAAHEQLRRIEHALAALPAADRELITLVRLCGLTHAQTAERTGRSEDACRQGLRRALVRLAAALDQQA
jgi:RNA polymerase sigma factor (sigma-70 family)